MQPQRARPAILAALALLAGCQAEEKLAPPTPTVPADIQAYAYYLTIDVEAGTVQVTPPTRQGAGQPGARLAYSLMGNDIVTLTTTNLIRGNVGSGGPNKRKITFDLALTNKLSVSDLNTPTFPLPPNGVQGLLAFPYTVAAFGVQGGKATPSADWNGTGAAGSGAPTNFFNDFASCPTSVTSDCYRWELFPAPLFPGATTPAQKVGFTVDAGVTTVATYVVIAADLIDHPPPPPQPGKGAITGKVTSSLGGAIAGATVTVSPGGATATTDGIGGFVVTGLDVGAVTLALGNLPANCTAPTPPSVTVTSGGIAQADLVAACLPTFGTVTGQVEILNVQQFAGLLPDPLTGTLVQLGGEQAYTDVTGSYQITNVPSGSYGITPANFPGISGCTLQSPVTIAVGSGPVTAPTITLDCNRTITVTVRDAATSAPRPDVTVSIGSFFISVSGVTDQNGTFVTGSVVTGWYDVAVGGIPGCTVTGPTSPVLMLPLLSQQLDYRIDCPAPPTATLVAVLGGTTLVPTPSGLDWTSVGQLEARDGAGNVVAVGGWDPVYGAPSVTVPAPGTYQIRGLPDSPFPQAMGCATDTPTVTVPSGGGALSVNLTVSCPNGAAWGVVTLDGAPDLTDLVVVIDPINPSPPFWTMTPVSSGNLAIYVVGLPANQPAELYVVDPVGPNRTCQPSVPVLTVPAVQFVQQNLVCQSQ